MLGTRLSPKSVAATAATTLVAGVLLAGPLATSAYAAPMTFTVNTAGNAADTFLDGNCDTAATAGLQCTLRGAIQEANNNPGLDTINFSLPSPYRITLTSNGLPQITSPVLIDGTSETGFSPGTGVIVRVDGVTATTGVQDGFAIMSGGAGTTIKGLEIDRFGSAGIRVSADNNTVSGNYIGTTAASLVNCAAGSSCGNASGVVVQDGTNNVIGGTTAADRNIISNNYYGLFVIDDPNVVAPPSNTAIRGNYIGTNVAGTAALGNSYGVFSYDYFGSGVSPVATTVGGTAAGAGNLISGNTGEGVNVQFGSWTFAGNLIGVNAAGSAAIANGGTAGIYVTGPTTSATIGGAMTAARNVISGNTQEGVEVAGPTLPVTLRGNYLGTNPAGTGVIGNGSAGVYAYFTDDLVIDGNLAAGNADEYRVDNGVGATITNNTAGLAANGTAALSNAASDIVLNSTVDAVVDTNVLATASSYGLYAYDTDGLVVTNNKIGTDVSGTLDRGNFQGLYLGSSTEATIGKAGNGNLISGNDSYAVQAYDDDDSTIQANLIGTEVTGAGALSNNDVGLYLSGSSRILIGGTSAGQRNVIAASQVNAGIYLSTSDDNDIVGNRVGVGASGGAIPNAGAGIYVDGSSDLNSIGDGTVAGGNQIANNADIGVSVQGNGYGNSVRGNSIHGNGALGIDLGGDGVTANDTGDRDNGGNRLQNFPVLTASVANASATQVSGTLNSRANRQYTLDFYANSACDASGNGEGETYLGSSSVTTNGSGNASFQATLGTAAAAGSQITATASDSSLGDTSEFSACIANQGGLPSASVANVSAAESVGSMTFTVSLSSAPVLTPVTVSYATADGTATAPADYTATSGTVTFNAGETTKSVAVPIVNDTLDEADETFTLTLSSPMNAIIQSGQASATGTIQDDDAPPTLSVANAANVTEPDAGSVSQTFTVNLSAVSSLPVSVDASTVTGTALEGVDFTPTAAHLTFAPGETSKTFQVAVLGDLLDEDNEKYSALLQSPVNATIATGSATATIVDNDPPPTVSIGDVTLAEGNAGKTKFTFPVTLSAPSGKNITVTLSTATGTATGSDYKSRTNFALIVKAGKTSGNFAVFVLGDTNVEANEAFNANIVSVTNATISDGSAVGTILNDD